MNHLLPLIWAGIISFCILMYVTLDGFTLGTGILMPFMSRKERELALGMILPTWDGNQTWLVLGAASLYGAFPMAFGIILPLLYLPIILMVMALLFRGVAFEFRVKASERGQKFWDYCFIGGSVVATLAQGAVLGTFIKGFSDVLGVTYPQFSWLSLYSTYTAVALVFGYALLGATRMVLKTEGELQAKMRRFAKGLSWMIAFFLLTVSLWTPFIDSAIQINWFGPHRMGYVIIMPMITGLAWLGLVFSLKANKEKAPYWFSIIIFCCCFAGFAIGIWPDVLPHTISIWSAASQPISLKFMLVGAAIMIPVLFFYTGYAYKIFSGKVKDAIHY